MEDESRFTEILYPAPPSTSCQRVYVRMAETSAARCGGDWVL